MHLTELTGAAGLFLVAILGGSDLGDGLTIGDTRGEGLHIDFILIFETPFDDIDVLLALGHQDGLLHFLVVFHDDGGILGGNLGKGFAHLLFVLLLGGLDGAAILGSREYDMLVRFVKAGHGQRSVGLGGTEFHGTTDITGLHLGHFFFLLAGHGVEGADALFLTRLGILEILTFIERSAHHLEVGHLTEVLLDGRLINKEGGLAGSIASDFVTFDSLGFALGGSGSHIDSEFHQAFHTDVLLAAEAENRQDFTAADTDAQTLADFILAQFTGLEEFLHQSLVVLGGTLDQFVAEVFGLRSKFGGNVFVFPLAHIVEKMIVAHFQHIDEAVKAHTGIHGELNDDGLLAERLFHSIQRTLPVGFLTIELVDGAQKRNVVGLGIALINLGTHLDTLLGVDHQDTGLANLERGDGTSDEIVGTRRVDDIELGVHEFRIQWSGIDGTLVKLLDLCVVGHGVLAFNGTFAVDDFALEEHRLG